MPMPSRPDREMCMTQTETGREKYAQRKVVIERQSEGEGGPDRFKKRKTERCGLDSECMSEMS